MFILEGERIACVQCIRGHRAADCFHRRKPLISIKSRGRPPQHEKNIRCRYQNVFITHQGKEPIETKNGRADPGVTKKAMYVHPCCKYTLVRVRLGKGFSVLSELTLAEAKIFLQGKEDDFKYDCLDWARQGHSCSPQELENNGGGRLFMETRFDQQECPRPHGKDDNHENYPERPPRAFSKEETHALQEFALRSGLHSHLNSEIAACTTFEELLDKIPEVVVELPQQALPQEQTYFQESQEQQIPNIGYNAPTYTHQFEEPNYNFANNDKGYSALVHTTSYELSPPPQNPQKKDEKAFYNNSIDDGYVDTDNEFVEEAKNFNFAIMFKEEEENIVPFCQPPPLPSTNYEDGCVPETIQVKAIPQSNVHLNPNVFREYNQSQQHQRIHIARQVKKESEERARRQRAEAEMIKKHTFITQNHHCLVTEKILFINDRAFGLAPSDKKLSVGQPYGQYKVMQTDTGVKFLIPPVILDEAYTNKVKQLTAIAKDHQLQYQANASQAQSQSQVQDQPRVPAPTIDQFSTEQALFENQECRPMSDEEFNNFLRANNLTEETFTESDNDRAKSNEFVDTALNPSSEPVQESIEYEDALEFIQQFQQTQQVELQFEEPQSDTELRLNQWAKSLEDQGKEENPNLSVQPRVSLAQVVNFENVELPAPVENGELFNDEINLDDLFANGFNLEQDGFLQDDQFSQCFNEFNQPYINGPEQKEN